jgi:hypothetical protein
MDEITPHKSNPKPTFGLSFLSLLMSPQNHQKGNLMFTFAKSDQMYFIQKSTNRHKVLEQSAINLPTCAKEDKTHGEHLLRYKTQQCGIGGYKANKRRMSLIIMTLTNKQNLHWCTLSGMHC